MRFANQRPLQFSAACNSVPEAFERGLKSALPEAVEVVRCCPPEVRVAVEERRLGILLIAFVRQGGVSVLGAEGAEIAGVGEEEVEDDGAVEGPVAGVVEDEYAVDFEAGGEVCWVDGTG